MATTTRRGRREPARLSLRSVLLDAMGGRGRLPINQGLYTLPFPIGGGNMAAGGGPNKGGKAQHPRPRAPRSRGGPARGGPPGGKGGAGPAQCRGKTAPGAAERGKNN